MYVQLNHEPILLKHSMQTQVLLENKSFYYNSVGFPRWSYSTRNLRIEEKAKTTKKYFETKSLLQESFFHFFILLRSEVATCSLLLWMHGGAYIWIFTKIAA